MKKSLKKKKMASKRALKRASKRVPKDAIDKQIQIFEHFIFNLIDMLHNFNVELINKTIKLESIYLFKPFTEEPFPNKQEYLKKICEHAKYIYRNYNPKLTFRISPGIVYSLRNLSGKRSISKGTCFGTEIVNFYRSSLKYNNGIINTYRFGTPLKYKDKTRQINKFVGVIKKENKNKQIVIISLLGSCNNDDLSCKFFRSVSFISKPLADSLKEDEILDKELARKDIHTISFPLRASKYNGIRLLMSLKENTSEDVHVSKMISFVNVNSGEETFEGIVKISMYFYFNCLDDYVLGYHCKSSKERSQLFESINKATYYYIITTNMSYENYKEIEKNDFNGIMNHIKELSLNFMYYGLIIGYFSTGNVGLKLSTSDLGKYVLGDKFKGFVGYN
jgi:hypothetical protein